MLTAVEAAWPDPSMRGDVLPDIIREAAGDGPTAARFLAHLVAEWPDSSTRGQRVLRLLEGMTDEAWSGCGPSSSRRTRDSRVSTRSWTESSRPSR